MRILKIALAAGAALAALASSAGTAGAHAEYERSEPADGAVLEESPPRVDVWYSQELRRSGGLPVLMVVKDNGDQVDLGATLDDEDRHHIYAELAPALPPGRYTVIYNVLSDEDGEETWGAFQYYVGEGPEATPGPATSGTPAGTPSLAETPAPTPTALSPTPPADTDASGDDGSSDVPLWGLVVGVVGALAVGGGAGTFVGRRLGQ